MAINTGTPVMGIQQFRDRRNDREVKFAATTANSYLGYTLSTASGSTEVTSTKGLLNLGGSTYLRNFSTGIEWYNLAVYTNQTTGMVGIQRYYSQTTSTYTVEQLSTAATIPSSQWNYFRFPLGAGEYGDICLSATSAATCTYHIVVQEANGLF